MGQRERTGWFLETKSGGIPSNTQSQKEAPLGHQKWEPRLGWAVEAAGTEPGYLGSIAEVPWLKMRWALWWQKRVCFWWYGAKPCLQRMLRTHEHGNRGSPTMPKVTLPHQFATASGTTNISPSHSAPKHPPSGPVKEVPSRYGRWGGLFGIVWVGKGLCFMWGSLNSEGHWVGGSIWG